MGEGSRSKALIVGALGLALVMALAGCGSSGSTTSPETGGTNGSSGSGATGLPESSDPTLDAGRQLIETKCTLCHTLDRIKQAQHDEAAWKETVARMRQNGAVITDEEAQQIVDYLVSR